MQLQPVHVWYGTTCSWVPWAFGNHHPQDLASRVDPCSACLSPWCSWSTLVSIQGCADTALIASIPADVLDPAKLCSVPVTRAAVVWSPKQQSCVFGTHRCAQVASGVDLPTIHPINLSALIWTSCLDFLAAIRTPQPNLSAVAAAAGYTDSACSRVLDCLPAIITQNSSRGLEGQCSVAEQQRALGCSRQQCSAK
jgi:hypothetical protein